MPPSALLPLSRLVWMERRTVLVVDLRLPLRRTPTSESWKPCEDGSPRKFTCSHCQVSFPLSESLLTFFFHPFDMPALGVLEEPATREGMG